MAFILLLSTISLIATHLSHPKVMPLAIGVVISIIVGAVVHYIYNGSILDYMALLWTDGALVLNLVAACIIARKKMAT
jgi:large-conductance mechanosensitive channel